MPHTRCRIVAFLTATSFVLACGCGQGVPSPSSSSAEATVTGKVMLRGKPATQGSVSFDPANMQRPKEVARVATIGADGSYTVKTLVGDNAVRISFPGMEKDRDLSSSSEQSYDVKPGENRFDIQLPRP